HVLVSHSLTRIDESLAGSLLEHKVAGGWDVAAIHVEVDGICRRQRHTHTAGRARSAITFAVGLIAFRRVAVIGASSLSHRAGEAIRRGKTDRICPGAQSA